jgi:hypothetical protein
MRELDRRVAVEVMGWRGGPCRWCGGTGRGEGHAEGLRCWMCFGDRVALAQQYSGSMDAAWHVVDKVHAMGHALVLEYKAGLRRWFALFDLEDGHDTGSVAAETAPEAICRAALKAVRVSAAPAAPVPPAPPARPGSTS